MAIPRLDRKYWRCNFNFEMIMSVITHFGESDTLDVYGHFRSKKDIGAIYWEMRDTWSHSSQAYSRVNDFTGVVWSFSINLTGDMKGLDVAHGPTLTVYFTDGSYKYVRLWNYAQAGRTATAADIILDFDAMSAGWDADDPVDPRYVDKLSISFVHEDYDGGTTTTPLAASAPFHVEITNWVVTGDDIGEEPATLDSHNYRLADGYDDNYDVTPQRYVEQFWALGFRDTINLYLGASHYYDKIAVSPLEAGDYTEYRYEADSSVSLNDATEAWLTDFLLRAAYRGYSRVILSVSQEMYDAPLAWAQKAHDGTYARTGWTPAPYVIDAFCNTDAQDYFKALALKLCELQDDAGLTPCFQLGEPWWWTQDSMPCFYGDATVAEFTTDFGYAPHDFASVFADFAAYEAEILWYQEKNGDYSHLIRDYIKATYANAEFTVLFYPPAVVDIETAGGMMFVANYPTTHWASPELDFFQVEDYGWLIDNDLDWHYQIWNMIQTDLGYATADIQYFAGFVLLPTQSNLWRRINHAAQDAICRGFMDSFIWAGAQIRRDDWTPPDGIGDYLLWWKDFTAKEEDGEYLIDYSGWLNDGAFAGAAEFIDVPAKGKVISLENNEDYVFTSVCGDQYLLTSCTVEAWIYVDSPHSGDIVYRDDSFRLYLTNGMPGIAFYDGLSWTAADGNTAVNYSAWNHVAGIIDSVGLLAIYLNGVEIGRTTIENVLIIDDAPTILDIGDGSDGLAVGWGILPKNSELIQVGYSGAGGQIYGKIAEVVIKDRASTQTEIRIDMARWLWREHMDVLELIEVWTPYQTAPLTYCSASAAVDVTSYDHLESIVTYTYNPLGFDRDGIKREMIGSQTQTTITLAAGVELQELLQNYDIRGYKIGIKMTYYSMDHTNPDNVLPIFLGQIMSWTLANSVLEITAREHTLDLGGSVPPAQFDYFCRHYFTRNRCRYAGVDTVCTKTETDCQGKSNEIYFGGFKFVPRLMRRKGF